MTAKELVDKLIQLGVMHGSDIEVRFADSESEEYNGTIDIKSVYSVKQPIPNLYSDKTATFILLR
jgi:hypothetical protein